VREHRLIHAVLAAAAACAGLAHAQEVTPVGGLEECATLYVDSVCGNDSNPGTAAAPLQTARTAIMRAGALRVPATVLFMPGDYDGGGSPILMPSGVSLMGTSILNTNFRGDSLIFAAPTQGAYDDVIVENIAFRGGGNQTALVTVVNAANRPLASNPTFSNCIFVDSSEIGVLIRSINSGVPPLMDFEDADGNGLLEHRPKFINCTFAQNRWGVVDASSAGWGENEAGFINCLFHNHVWPSLSDMEGVDSSDVRLTNSTAVSNAWHWTNRSSPPIASTSIKPGRFAPSSQGTADHVFDTMGAFRLLLDRSAVVNAPGDFRLTPEDQPDNSAVNSGVVNFNPKWENGTIGQRFFRCGQDAWDTDGEGYGNVRIFEGTVDIGADEMGMFVVAGFSEGTTIIPRPTTPDPFGLRSYSVWQARPLPFGTPHDGFLLLSGLRASDCGDWTPLLSGTPGLNAAHAIAPTPIFVPGLGNLGTLYMLDNWAGLRSNGVANRFTPVQVQLEDHPTTVQVNHQIIPFYTQFFPLSNLQSFYLE